jgi:hypothetical protein
MRKQHTGFAASGRLALALAVASTLLMATDKGPDAGNYTATDNAVFSFIDLVGSGGSASVLAGADDDVALLTLPFPFQFYGTSYTMVCASANGSLTFVSTAAACVNRLDFANTDLATTAPPGDGPAILPFWSDLTFQVAGGGAVYYGAQGTPGSRRFVLEWSNAYPQGSANPVTFEVVLYEGSNKILLQYQTVDLGAANPAGNGALATVGVRAAGGNTNGKQLAWSFDAAVLGNSKAIQITPPVSAQASVNTITTNPTGLTVTIDGVPYVAPKVVSWTPNTPHTLSVVSQQVNGGTRTTFTNWGAAGSTPSVSITAGATGTTYTATFTTEYQLTTSVNPAAGGFISGAGWYTAGNSVPVQATAASGYTFAYFSGALTGSTNPQNLTMSAPKSVGANFQAAAGNPTLGVLVSTRADGGVAGQRVWSLRVMNVGNAAAANAQITGLTLTQTAGTPCAPAPSVVTALPLSVGTIAVAGTANSAVTLALGGCDTTARFSAKFNFSANSGAYTGSTTLSNQTR